MSTCIDMHMCNTSKFSMLFSTLLGGDVTCVVTPSPLALALVGLDGGRFLKWVWPLGYEDTLGCLLDEVVIVDTLVG